MNAYNNRGTTEVLLKNYKGAIEDFNQAIKLNPKNAESYINRGTARDYLKDYKREIEDFNKGIELDSKNGYAYLMRGLANISLRQKSKGCLDFSKAGELGNKVAYEFIKRYSKWLSEYVFMNSQYQAFLKYLSKMDIGMLDLILDKKQLSYRTEFV